MTPEPPGPSPTLSEDEAAEKAKDRLVEIHSKLFDRAAANTNLILIGGYAGAFTIWSSTKAQLPPRASILTALLLGASLTVFILFEVYKMTKNARQARRISNALVTATSPQHFLDKCRAIEKQGLQENVLFTRVWVVCLAICLLSALPAILLLFYNFVAVLVGISGWPT